MKFGPDGSVTAGLDDPEGLRKRYRDAGRLRTDARRTAEYLASRGLTPIENLHNVARMELPDAVAYLMEHGGCTKHQALQFWFQCAAALLPYTAPRFDSIDITALAASAAAGGSLAVAHFLAAQAASAQLGRDREALAAAGGPGMVALEHAPLAQGGADPAAEHALELEGQLPPIGPD